MILTKDAGILFEVTPIINVRYTLAWEVLCTSKHCGGLGLCEARSMNKVLLMKAGWWLLLGPKTLWASIINAKYVWGGQNPSSYC